jgi:hypothetical protein
LRCVSATICTFKRRWRSASVDARAARRSYAHELLHLFGAPDLYVHPWRILRRRLKPDETIERLEHGMIKSANRVFDTYFGRSIMCNPLMGLDGVIIDPITARAVGWPVPDEELFAAMKTLELGRLELVSDAVRALDWKGTECSE